MRYGFATLPNERLVNRDLIEELEVKDKRIDLRFVSGKEKRYSGEDAVIILRGFGMHEAADKFVSK